MVDIGELKAEARQMSGWEQHRFLFMVVGVIITALVLVVISMVLYSNDGAAQVDLSRPGYQAVRGQVSRRDDVETFSSTGELDKASMDKFEKLYAERSSKVLDVAGFSSDAMSDDSLQIFSENNTNITID